jgi:hypothetical protein
MIFLLKLLRKILGLFLKLVLLPFRLVLRLVRGSDGNSSQDDSTVASAATSAATAAASSAAATAGETADDVRDSQATTAGTGQPVDPSVRTNYDRFRKALYAYAGLGALVYVFVLVQFGAPVRAILAPLAVGTVLPAALGYWAHTGSRLAWGAGMAYAALFVLLSFAGTIGVVNLGPSATRAFDDLLGGGVVMLLGVLSLLQVGSLAAGLYFGATGRAVALGASTAVSQPATGESEAAAAEASPQQQPDGAPTEPSSDTASAQRSGTPAASERSETTTPETGETGHGAGGTPTDAGSSVESPADGTTATDAADPGATDAGTADAASAAAGTPGAASKTAGPTDAGTAAGEPAAAEAATESDDRGADDTPSAVAGLAEEAASTRDPEAIRNLGDRIDGGPVPDEVVTALETCAEADDPDVRVAVCDACAAITDDEVASILGRLRIDTNDRVATAAMEAY